VTNIDVPAEGLPPVYQVRLPLSTAAITQVSKALRTYRAEVKSRWRKLPDLTAALLVLAVLRHDQRPDDVARAHGISALTLRRWTTQALTVLARKAPRLDRVLARAARRRATEPALLLDGTCLPVHRPAGRAEKRYWCPKHKAHHLRVMTLTDQHGRLLWISAATGAGTHETRQAKRLHLPQRLRDHDLAIIVDRYHTRLDDQPDTNPTVMVGRRGSLNHKLTPAEKQVNNLLSAERATNEHAHAHLKNWRGTTRLRHGWMRNNTTTLLRALLGLTNTEINR
jgi:DDE superfamily endonuclease